MRGAAAFSRRCAAAGLAAAAFAAAFTSPHIAPAEEAGLDGAWGPTTRTLVSSFVAVPQGVLIRTSIPVPTTASADADLFSRGPGTPGTDASPATSRSGPSAVSRRPAQADARLGRLAALDAEAARHPRRFWPHIERVRLALDLGDGARALSAVESAREAAQDLAERAVVQETIGDLASFRGDLQAADRAFKEAEAILRPVSAEAESQQRLRRNLSIVLAKRADLASLQGDIAKAERLNTEVIALRRAMTDADPRSGEDLADALDVAGDLATKRDDLLTAEQFFIEAFKVRSAAQRASLGISGVMAGAIGAIPSGTGRGTSGATSAGAVLGSILGGRASPERFGGDYTFNTASAPSQPTPASSSMRRLLWDQARQRIRAGTVAMAEGDTNSASQAFDSAVSSLRSLSRNDRDPLLRRDLALALDRAGDLAAAGDDRTRAIAAWREALALRRTLAAERPRDATAARDLGVSLARMALAGQGVTWAEVAAHLRAMKARQQLPSADERVLAQAEALATGQRTP